ncbi:gas vesicle protein [Nonomuraea pusilla]|uniref:gas vesicle protein GvpO n=1 Tax=Nonomuraea pusilla TaxID=46177 RepID=UPI003319F3DB
MPAQRRLRAKRPPENVEPFDELPEQERPEEEPPLHDRAQEPSGPAGRRLNAATAGGAGLRHITELTAREAEGVTLVKPQGDGWLVDVEVVEDRRIPSSGDILALYEAELDAGGDLVSYRRLKRYRRGSGDLGEATR